MWKFPQQNSLFHTLHVSYLTPRVWGLALLFTIRVAVHDSNFLIKAPQPSSKSPLLQLWDYLLGPEVQIGASEDSRWAKVIHGFPVGHTNKGKHSSWMPLLKSAAAERKSGRDRAELSGDNSLRVYLVCVCVHAHACECGRVCVFYGIICGTIKWGEPGFKTWCDQREWGQGPGPEEGRTKGAFGQMKKSSSLSHWKFTVQL